MIRYIIEDMREALPCLSRGILTGVPPALLTVSGINILRRKRKKAPLHPLPAVLFCAYIGVMLVITFFSRESGSRMGAPDLRLFSTWKINDRNRAFVIENVLLFIPYGFLYRLNFRRTGTLPRCLALGTFTSLFIELMQLWTGRGYFQLDDIWTNALGALIGGILFLPFTGKGEEAESDSGGASGRSGEKR